MLKGILVCQVCYKTKQNKTKQKKNKKTKQTNKKTPKNHRLGDLNNRDFFLTVLETESPRSCYSQDWFLLRPFSLACTQDPSHSVLKWPFSCAFVFSVSLHRLVRTASYHIRVLPSWPHLTIMTSLKAPSRTIITLGVRVSTYEFGRDRMWSRRDKLSLSNFTRKNLKVILSRSQKSRGQQRMSWLDSITTHWI